MEISLSLLAYWRNQKLSATECSRVLVAFLKDLSQCDPIFSRWFLPTKPPVQLAGPDAEPDVEFLAQYMIKEEEKADREFGKPTNLNPEIEGLGYLVTFNNGEKKEKLASTLMLRCGNYGSHVLFPNNGKLSFPFENQEVFDRLLKPETIMCILRAFAKNWRMVYSYVYSGDLFCKNMYEGNDSGMRVGNVTFIALPSNLIPELPEPSYVQPLEPYGSIIFITRERFTAYNPSHVEAYQRVAKILLGSGLLPPHLLEDDPSIYIS